MGGRGSARLFAKRIAAVSGAGVRAACVVVAVASTTAVVQPPAQAAGTCAFVAHRGGSFGSYTENGLARIQAAHAAGIRQFEVDVRTSASGTAWIMHDATVDRTVGNATGAVAAKSDAQMQAMRLRDGEPVPTLQSVIDYAGVNNMDPVLHVKAMTTTSWNSLVTLVRAYGLQSRVVIMGDATLLSTARKLAPEMATMLLDYKAISVSRVTNFSGAVVQWKAVTAQNVADIHAAGKLFWTFDSYSTTQWKTLTKLDVDSNLVNNVSAFMKYQAAGCPV